jgi:hypothetical protein
MDMETARLTNISWLRPADPQVVAMHAVLLRPDRSWIQAGKLSAKDPLPVPTLGWPATLFQDGTLCH